jgi:DNA-binding transcriptional ArsR family regulator
LIALFRFAPSTVSKHMSLLAEAGLVQSRRDGRWTYFSLPENSVEPVAAALNLVDLMAGGDPVVAEDRGKLPELACR